MEIDRIFTQIHMENDINKAVDELTALNDFLNGLSTKPTKDVIETLSQKNPDYIEAVSSTGVMPERTLDLVMDYGIWSLFRLRSIYEPVWDKAIEVYYEKSSAYKGTQMIKAIWTHVEMVIKNP